MKILHSRRRRIALGLGLIVVPSLVALMVINVGQHGALHGAAPLGASLSGDSTCDQDGNCEVTGIANLDGDTTVTGTLMIDNHASLDLNGHTITVIGDTTNEGYIVDPVGGGAFGGSITNNASGTIDGGTFSGSVDNNGGIIGDNAISDDSTMTFNGQVTNENYANLNHGTFNGGVINTSISYISGGKFSGSSTVSNSMNALIQGGTFDSSVFINNYATINGSLEIDGTVENFSTISGGSSHFTGSVNNWELIQGGWFSGPVTNEQGIPVISGGAFDSSVNNIGQIHGGSYSGSVTNQNNSFIYSGTFSGTVDNYGTIDMTAASGFGPPDFTNAIVTREDGDMINCPGVLIWSDNQCAAPSTYHWVGGTSGSEQAWSTASNWQENSVPPDGADIDIPSTDGAYDPIFTGTISSGNITIENGATLNNEGSITGGTFVGSGNILNNADVYGYATGLISGGTFTGVSIANQPGTITGGSFNGEIFNNSGELRDGIFSGTIDNFAWIEGGTYTGQILNETNGQLDMSGIQFGPPDISGATYIDDGGRVICTSGNYWNGSSCVVTLGNGESCTDASQCSSSICIYGLCLGGASLGQSCEQYFDCDGTAMCGSDFVCGGEGAFCQQTDGSCVSPNACHHNLCTDASKYGSSCDNDDECSSTTGHCDTSTNVCDCSSGNWDGSTCAVSAVTFDAQGGIASVGTCGTIISSGTYTLTTNLTSSNGDCITVSSDVTGVVIDGAGTFSITNTSSSNSDSAIHISNGAEASVRNINITLNNGGALSGGYGIYNGGTLTDMSGTTVDDYTGTGIFNNDRSSTIVDMSGTVDNYGTGIGFENGPQSSIQNISGSINNLGSGVGIDSYGATITINSTPTITNSGGGTSFTVNGGGIVNGSGVLNGDITVLNGSTLDLSGGLTINGIVTNNGGTVSCDYGQYFDGSQCTLLTDNGASCLTDIQCISNWADGGLGGECSQGVCGGVGATCPGGSYADMYCDGTNGIHCSATVDPNATFNTCGGTGASCTDSTQCESSISCNGGICSSDTSSSSSSSCTTDAQCSLDMYCSGTTCVLGCRSTSDCSDGFVCTSHVCSVTSSSASSTPSSESSSISSIVRTGGGGGGGGNRGRTGGSNTTTLGIPGALGVKGVSENLGGSSSSFVNSSALLESRREARLRDRSSASSSAGSGLHSPVATLPFHPSASPAVLTLHDVPAGAWYAPAAIKGVMNGWMMAPSGTFSPAGFVSVSDMATALTALKVKSTYFDQHAKNTANILTKGEFLQIITDAFSSKLQAILKTKSQSEYSRVWNAIPSSVSHYASVRMSILAGWISMPQGSFHGLDLITRAEMAKILLNVVGM